MLDTIILAALFLILFGIAELLYHIFKIKAEVTRKLVHIGTGLLTLLFPVMLDNYLQVLLLCAVFFVILVFSLKFNLLRSINAINRKSVGSLCYPASVFICYLAYTYFNKQLIYFYLPVLILAVCDPLAALTGKKWPIGRFRHDSENKTMTGSIAFFLSATAIIVVLSLLLKEGISVNEMLMRIIIIASAAAISEGFSKKGYDNLTIPIVVLTALIITENII